MIRLHWFWSSNPQKVRLALEELELSYELAEVDLFERAHKTPEYRAIHPRAKVPALEIDDQVLWESNAAIQWLGEREKRLWPATGADRALALNLLSMEAAAFQAAAGPPFFQRAVMPLLGKDPDEASIEEAHREIQPLFDVLEQTLGDGDYLLGAHSLVDCAYGPWLPTLDLGDRPRLAAWRQRLRERPAWARSDFRY